jgi:hypothetical protein
LTFDYLFVLTARFQRVSTPFGVDIIYYFHWQTAVVTLIFILAIQSRWHSLPPLPCPGPCAPVAAMVAPANPRATRKIPPESEPGGACTSSTNKGARTSSR